VSTAEERSNAAGLGRMVSDLRRWSLANLRYATDLILPPICIHCHTPIAAHRVLCPACWKDVDFITPPLCDRLGLPLPHADGETALSTAALRDPPIFGRARAAARFNGVMRTLIHSFKYGDRHEASDMFAQMMRAAGAGLLEDADVLMPVPLHPRKLSQRRYNQAAILAGRLSRLARLPADMTSLRRVRRTPSQVGLSEAERQSNVANAFAIAPKAEGRIAGKHILLVDDVITTGSTLSACARVLKEAGAAEVNCLAVAMAVGEDEAGAS